MTEADIMGLINRLGKLSGDLAAEGDDLHVTLQAAAQALYELVRERDMYQHRSLMAARQCDEMTMKLAALQARRSNGAKV